ncbi:hypothetical protein CPSG_03783 [Coccidioides posadasii str. Silveira]|uniref:Uncharacterized protein n=2 Tax=Coccidioides posadasii TaxID=199306 RepID=E9D2I5_COCPS|nr:hypothetical protein CPSG_03783 [Coccidioides posadasii str. Silveira]KMM71858.1 hypothetical protein CPAG_08159 [Coccidioides posadasii RMSCC 3488]
MSEEIAGNIINSGDHRRRCKPYKIEHNISPAAGRSPLEMPYFSLRHLSRQGILVYRCLPPASRQQAGLRSQAVFMQLVGHLGGYE